MDERERLLSAIAADPDAIENWIVYADWLTDHGDRRGELIALELAIEAKVANEEAIERHRVLLRDETAWLSPRLEAEWHHVSIAWWRGFIRGAHVFGPQDDPPTRETVAALFADPHACVLHELHLRNDPRPLLAELRCESLRDLHSLTYVRELDVAMMFPRLESLDLGDRDDIRGLERLEHPLVKRLRSACPALRTGHFALPSLEHLEPTADPIILFGPHGILQEPPPRLTQISTPIPSPELISAIRKSRLCNQLRSLSMRHVDGAEIFEELLRDPRSFQHVRLEIDGSMDVAAERDAVIARMKQQFPDAKLDIWCEDDPVEEDEPPPPTVDPATTRAIGDAVLRLVDKMKARLPKP